MKIEWFNNLNHQHEDKVVRRIEYKGKVYKIVECMICKKIRMEPTNEIWTSR